jgi:tRNA G10  N-methylase Trm11
MSANELTLSELEALARQENVHGKTVDCLLALQSDDEEIRTWASEALSGSIEPIAGEEEEMAGLLESVLYAGEEGESWDALAVDQLYWTATMLGRLNHLDPSTKKVLQELAESTSTTLAPAAKRARSVVERMRD